MDVIKEILTEIGYESAKNLEINDSITVKSRSESFIDLTIERTAVNEISVAHYYEQNGESHA